jgi:hypothetical protein
MSRVVTHNESWSGYPVSYDTTNSTITGSDVSRGYKSIENANSQYASFNPSSNGVFYFFYNFQTPTIPSNSVINNISCQARARDYSTGNRGSGNISLCSGITPKGTPTTLTTTVTTHTLNVGNWTASEFNNGVELQLTLNRTKTGYYIRFYASTLSIDYSWDEYFYSITTSSTAQGVTISASENETTSGGTNTITLTNVSSLSAIQLIDNGDDVTSSLVASGSNYIYTLSNVSDDHTIVVSDVQQQTSSLYRKTNSWSQYTKVYKKTNNSWVQQTISLDLFDGNKIIVSG